MVGSQGVGGWICMALNLRVSTSKCSTAQKEEERKGRGGGGKKRPKKDDMTAGDVLWWPWWWGAIIIHAKKKNKKCGQKYILMIPWGRDSLPPWWYLLVWWRIIITHNHAWKMNVSLCTLSLCVCDEWAQIILRNEDTNKLKRLTLLFIIVEVMWQIVYQRLHESQLINIWILYTILN